MFGILAAGIVGGAISGAISGGGLLDDLKKAVISDYGSLDRGAGLINPANEKDLANELSTLEFKDGKYYTISLDGFITYSQWLLDFLNGHQVNDDDYKLLCGNLTKLIEYLTKEKDITQITRSAETIKLNIMTCDVKNLLIFDGWQIANLLAKYLFEKIEKGQIKVVK